MRHDQRGADLNVVQNPEGTKYKADALYLYNFEKIHGGSKGYMSVPEGYVSRVLIAVAIVCAVALAWSIRDVLIVIFGGLIVATLLRTLSDGISRITPLQGKSAVGMAVAVVLILLVGVGWAIGDLVLTQMETLRERLPEAVEASRRWLYQSALGSRLLKQVQTAGPVDVPWDQVAGITGVAVGAITSIILILAIGLYVAGAPGLYRRGLVSLMPRHYRAAVQQAIAAAAKGLRLWLLGQMLSMAAIGTLTAVGLLLLSMPLALSLGIIAGLTAFIPFVGPLSFGVLAVLMAFTEGPEQALYVALLCLGIQQLEGYVITPLIQRRTVQLPPALGLVAMLIFGVLFGIPGVLLATPLVVVVMILVQKLYVEYGLEGRNAEN